jgi:oligosaccharyltransferase complex subunit beta
MFKVVTLLLILGLAALANANRNPRTLVLLESLKLRDSHSIFFKSLQDRGHKLTFSHVYGDDSVRLERYGEYLYDNLVLFAPSAEDLPEHIKLESVIAFIDSGHNVLVAGSHNVSEPVRAIANECGVDFDESETSVIDHLHFDMSSTDHRLIAAENWVNSPVMLGKGPSAPVLFNGIGHAATEGTRLITRVLTAGDSAYSAVPGHKVEEYPQSAGRDTLLVTALQARNNARVVFAGSLDMFSDKFFSSAVQSFSDKTGTPGKKYDKSGNEEFCIELSKWTFQERGLLRARDLQHRLQQKDAPLNPLAYRIKDDIHFQIVIEEWDQSKASWVPFTQNNVQLELVMLDPYIRKTLPHDGKGTFSADFTLPDVYGVYKFRIQHHKKGYSNLEVSQQVSVHPYRHNQFERFIDVAYPYYTSAFSMFAAFFIFGVVFLYSKDS